MQTASEPLEKVTLNLNHRDMVWLRNRYDRGVSEVIRNLVRKYVREIEEEEDGQ